MYYAYKPLECLRDGLHVLKWCIGLMPLLLTSWSLWYKMLFSEKFLLKKKTKKKTLAALLFSFVAFISRLHEIHAVCSYTNSFSQEDIFSLPAFQNSNKRVRHTFWPVTDLYSSKKRFAYRSSLLFHTYLQKEITQFFYKQPQDQVIFVTSFTSTYLACSFVFYAMHSCSQFL